MTFWEHFFRLLMRRPVPALAAAYWQLTKRRVRAGNRLRAASVDLPFAYKAWIGLNERPSGAAELAERCRRLQWRPRFSVVLHSASTATKELREQSLRSLDRQTYTHWTFADGTGSALEPSIATAEGDYIVPLRAGDLLSENALLRFAEAVQERPAPKVLYGDEDRLDQRGRRSRPWFKPQWNEELFLAQDYLGSAVAIEIGVAREAIADGARTMSALLLSATSEADGAIIHVPHILTHRRADAAGEDDRIAAVAQHVRGRRANALPGPFGSVKVQWPLPDQRPLVSIVVPTRDKLELLRPCIESVLGRTNYGNFEILIVDNGSREASTAQFLKQVEQNPKVRVLPYPHAYNFSAINNFAAAQARGSYLCLLNNDTEVVDATWLTELMRYAVRPEIGAAGAKLLYDDGSIQHAGVVVGIGEAAGHAHRFLPGDRPGYFAMAHVPQFVSAVTAACLVVEKRKFDAVGGLDAEQLAIAFNDVDLCLKIEAAGWRNVYVPHAVLVHHESRSRGSDMAPSQIDRYRQELKVLQERWGTRTYADPLHNPNLDRYNETFVFRL